jgi:hypothetical protein
MADQPKPPAGAAWPDPITGAQLVARMAHGLLTGPVAVAFMRQTALGPGAELMAGPLLDAAEALAMGAYARSLARQPASTNPDVAALFKQGVTHAR